MASDSSATHHRWLGSGRAVRSNGQEMRRRRDRMVWCRSNMVVEVEQRGQEAARRVGCWVSAADSGLNDFGLRDRRPADACCRLTD